MSADASGAGAEAITLGATMMSQPRAAISRARAMPSAKGYCSAIISRSTSGDPSALEEMVSTVYPWLRKYSAKAAVSWGRRVMIRADGIFFFFVTDGTDER